MDLFFKATAAVLIAVILILTVHRHEPDIGILLNLAICCMVTAVALGYLSPVFDFLSKLEALGKIDSNMTGILLKTVGIGMVSEIAGIVCADAGNASLGKALQLLGTTVILWMSLPLFDGLLELVQEILGGI